MGSMFLIIVGWGLGGFINGNLGFGAALVAMPLVTLGTNMALAVPASLLLFLVLNVQMAWSYRRYLVWKEVSRLLVGVLPGVAVGVFLLRDISESGLRLGLGSLLIVCGVWGLCSRKLRCKVVGGAWGMLAGFLSVILGMAFGINGPPPAAYLSLRGGTQHETKAVLGFFFVCSTVLIVAVQAMAGMVSFQVLKIFAVALPPMLLGGWMGIRLSARFNDAGFHLGMSVLLFVMGVVMVHRVFF